MSAVWRWLWWVARLCVADRNSQSDLPSDKNIHVYFWLLANGCYYMYISFCSREGGGGSKALCITVILMFNFYVKTWERFLCLHLNMMWEINCLSKTTRSTSWEIQQKYYSVPWLLAWLTVPTIIYHIITNHLSYYYYKAIVHLAHPSTHARYEKYPIHVPHSSYLQGLRWCSTMSVYICKLILNINCILTILHPGNTNELHVVPFQFSVSVLYNIHQYHKVKELSMSRLR